MKALRPLVAALAALAATAAQADITIGISLPLTGPASGLVWVTTLATGAPVGGAKVSSKLELLGNLSGIANTIVIGALVMAGAAELGARVFNVNWSSALGVMTRPDGFLSPFAFTFAGALLWPLLLAALQQRLHQLLERVLFGQKTKQFLFRHVDRLIVPLRAGHGFVLRSVV